jgi:glycosyltransferase involved in cell wall biosynthesis
MRLLFVSESTLAIGRGPLFRRMGILPHLAKRADLTFVSLGQSDSKFLSLVKRLKISLHRVDCVYDGWFVSNAAEIARFVSQIASRERCDLVIMEWELWDLVRALATQLENDDIPFATVLHAVPLLNCPPNPSRSFAIDVVFRLLSEGNSNVRRYIWRRAWTIARVLKRVEVVVPNETVGFYLSRYFPAARQHLSLPGYAVDLDEIAYVKANPECTEFVFLAKLVAEKGTLELLRILKLIVGTRPDCRLKLIGAFEDGDAEDEFWSMAGRLGVTDQIVATGWLSEEAKYSALKGAKVFLYPASMSDSFCIPIVEAIACGCSVICYDVPFSRLIYHDAPVHRVPLEDRPAFAAAALSALTRSPDIAKASSFLQKYASWKVAAEAEMAVLEHVVAIHKSASKRLGH